jgi:cystathionine beta-lyase/cystathionine gamma-synthase
MFRDKTIFTQAVHGGERAPRPDYTPISTPIAMSVGYVYDDMADVDRIFGLERDGYVYPRYGSPTVSAFERAVALLEGTDEAVAYASGMAAIHGALLAAGVGAERGVVCASDVYGATYSLVTRALAALGVRGRLVDITDLDEVAVALREEQPAALLCEVMSNPLLRVADVPALSEIAHNAGALLVVDSTFATPYLYRPATEGADLVVHSATKYLAGHGDVLAGIVACQAEDARTLRENQKLYGANLGPQEAWLSLRGLKTLPLRMREQCTSASRIAEWLPGHEAVAEVNYPGLSDHAQHRLATRLFAGRGYGAMMSLDLGELGRDGAYRFMETLQIVRPATTLGDITSLVLYPAMSSHRALPPEERAALGIGDGLVRLSVGIEAVEDLMDDLDQALAAASRG